MAGWLGGWAAEGQLLAARAGAPGTAAATAVDTATPSHGWPCKFPRPGQVNKMQPRGLGWDVRRRGGKGLLKISRKETTQPKKKQPPQSSCLRMRLCA